MKRLMAVVNTERQEHPTIDVALALLANEGGTIDIVTTMTRVPPILLAIWSGHGREFEREVLIEKQTKLNAILERRRVENVTMNTFVLQGKAFVEIINLANKNRVDTVLSDDLIDLDESSATVQGDTNFQLFRRCPQPVWLFNSSRPVVPAKIAAAIDVQDTDADNLILNSKILSTAIDLSEHFGAQLDVVHAWELFGESVIIRKFGIDEADRDRSEYIERIKTIAEPQLQIFKDRGASCEFHLLNGPPELAIPAFLNREEVDLMVMGTVGRSGISGIVMGNTAEKVLRTAKSSILALKPDGFRSGVA